MARTVNIHYFAFIRYILTIESEDDFNEFMDNIVDKSTPSHIAAYEALKANLFRMNLFAESNIVFYFFVLRIG